MAAVILLSLAACGGKTSVSSDNEAEQQQSQTDTSDIKDDGSGKDEALTEDGKCTQKQMENAIVSYFSDISSLSSLTLCDGSVIEYLAADIPWQTVDIWTIYDPTADYNDLADSMSSQLTAAGLSEREMESGGYEWYAPVGDKKMYIQLRAYYEGDDYYLIYATPEAE